MELDPQSLTWSSAMVEHEGFPLALRVRPTIDQPSIAAEFPHLAILSHALAKVRSDGLPEADYNESLAELDASVHDSLQTCGGGLVMIVETFGGTRNYYACVRGEDVLGTWLTTVLAGHVGHELTGRFVADRAWKVYRSYRRDFRW
jgi:hypothetical protein